MRAVEVPGGNGTPLTPAPHGCFQAGLPACCAVGLLPAAFRAARPSAPAAPAGTRGRPSSPSFPGVQDPEELWCRALASQRRHVHPGLGSTSTSSSARPPLSWERLSARPSPCTWCPAGLCQGRTMGVTPAHGPAVQAAGAGGWRWPWPWRPAPRRPAVSSAPVWRKVYFSSVPPAAVTPVRRRDDRVPGAG